MVSFNSVPTAVRTPFSFIEFDSSQSSSGASIQPYKLLLLGQKLAGGTATANTPVRITSVVQANGLFGTASMLADMVRSALNANSFTETWAIPLSDDAAGVAATTTLVITGPATADGTIALYLGGKAIKVGVISGDSASAIATKMVTAISAEATLPLTAAVNGSSPSSVDITFKHKGVSGNNYPMSLGLYGEVLPAGVGVTTPAFASGATNPTISAALASIGDEQFRTIVMPYTDSANLVSIEAFLAEKWGPMYTNDGHAFSATSAASSTAQTLGQGRNSPHLTIMSSYGSPTPAYDVAAILGATVAYNSPIDPARTLQRLELVGVIGPKLSDRLILSERNVLLYSGIATSTTAADGKVYIERLVTTYKTSPGGSPDESYLDYETLATLSYLRYDFRQFFATRYPRHKLAKSGTRVAPGQLVLTPIDAKAEAIGVFSNWEALGLVEDAAQFERDIIVEINATNPNRLDFYLPPNLINNLRIIGAKIAFRL